MSKKRCIFHIPYKINPDWPSGTNIRPIKMIDAFKSNGYKVDVVFGYGDERKKAINKIKRSIKDGIKYDFVYSESCTEPTLLTEKNHIPRYLFLDFAFLKFCRKNNIKVGLFYRDVQWRFDIYTKHVSFLKRTIAINFYKYDLQMYNKVLDVLYLPSKEMYEYIPINFKGKIEELPPALETKDFHSKRMQKRANKKISIFYVGGIRNIYNFEKLFQVVCSRNDTELIVCCREKEWNSVKYLYLKYCDNDKISVIHKSGEELRTYFESSDIFSLFLEPNDYLKFAIPVKMFEYLSYAKPIISTKSTANGQFISKYDIGWVINYSNKELSELLDLLVNNKGMIQDKIENIMKIIQYNTWEARADKVAKDLSIR